MGEAGGGATVRQAGASEEAGGAAGEPVPSWRREALGPLIVLVVAVGIELVSRFVTRIPNPPAVLMLVVAFVAFRSGVRSGLTSSLVAWGYYTVAFSQRGNLFDYAPDDLKRVVLWAVATPGLAVMIGTLRSRAVTAERAATREAELRFTRAFHASPVGVLLSRVRDGVVLDVNDVAMEAFGYAAEELLGKSEIELGLWSDPDQRSTVLARLRDDGSVRNVDVRARRRSGELADLLCSGELLGDGEDALVLVFFVDLTERRRTEAALRRSEQQLRATQKMEAIGRLAGGIAHDFNNLLMVIGGNAELLRRKLPAGGERTLANEISSASDRAANLIRQLLAFSRHEAIRPEALDLGAEISKLMSFLTRTIGESVTLSTDLASSLGCVRADPGQIDQVITNLVINARDAMPGGGQLTLSTFEETLDEAGATRLGGQAREGRFVVLEVRDTGLGVAPDAIDRVFEPFFTTKGRLGGTGLGLATVYGIVTSTGGFAVVDSEVGKGTRFRLYFPRVDDAVAADERDGHEAVSPGSAQILLVEDDAGVRAVTARMLASLGYDVVIAETPADAIAIAAGPDAASIDLVMTDVVMPNMNGRELVDQLEPMLPGAGILFFSGYPDDAALTEDIRTRSVALLPKPFSAEQLAAAVRGVLDDRAKRG